MSKNLEIFLGIICVILVDAQLTTDQMPIESWRFQRHGINVEELLYTTVVNVKNLLEEIMHASVAQKKNRQIIEEFNGLQNKSECQLEQQNQFRNIEDLIK